MPVTVAVPLLVPLEGPSVHSALARPSVPVATEAGASAPPPAVAAKATDVPATGLFQASRTSITTGLTSFWPTVFVCSLPLTTLSCVGEPAVPVAWKVTVGTLATDAVMLCAPAVVPRRQLVLASPLALVVTVAGVADPPLRGEKTTVAPA
jgi:hypothetical protein